MDGVANESGRSRGSLSRERVLQEAVLLADEGGIESLSMRKLAGALGVEAMSLYNYVANKSDLVDAIVELVISEIQLPSASESWDVAIRQCAISAHEAFLRHPWACGPAMSGTGNRMPRTPRLRYMEWLLMTLREAGFSLELTYHAYHALDSHILGFTLWQVGHIAAAKNLGAGMSLADLAAAVAEGLRSDGYIHLAEHAEQHMSPPPGREFEFGLDLILDGLKRVQRTP